MSDSPSTIPELALQPVSVMSDGGPHEGQLVFAGADLVAVFAQVSAEENATGAVQAPGWFLEAGFGPCSLLMTLRPPVFATLEAALDWVRDRLEAGFAPS